MTAKPSDRSPRAAGTNLELKYSDDRRKGAGARPSEREPRNGRNVIEPQEGEYHKHHHNPDDIVQERRAPTAPREEGETPHVLHQQEWQREANDAEHGPEGLSSAGAGNETSDSDDHSGYQRCSGRLRNAVTPFVRGDGTVSHDQQLPGYRPNGSQRERERRVGHTERAEIPGPDRPGNKQGKQEVGGAREQLVSKAPSEPPHHLDGSDGLYCDGDFIRGRRRSGRVVAPKSHARDRGSTPP